MGSLKTTAAAAMVVLIAAAGPAGAATPKAGKFQGVTSQKDHLAGSHRLTIEVRKRHGAARVASAELGFTMECEDGSSIVRSAHLPGSRIRSSGRFTAKTQSGGSYGPDGHISLRLSMSGRFAGAQRVEGTLEAKATVSESTTSPAVACFSGTVGWVGSRVG
jgi:hypothetical protein